MNRSWTCPAYVVTLGTLLFNLLFAAAFALPLVLAVALLV